MSRFSAFNRMLNRPHMAHINNTIVKKELVHLAGDEKAAYERYSMMVKKAQEQGYDDTRILADLDGEIERIEGDHRQGDELFQNGVRKAKDACISAIRLIISEIKGEQ